MLSLSLSPFPVLHTNRLLLRQMNAADAEALFQLRSDEDLMKYIARPLATTLQDVHDLIALCNENAEHNEGITWAVTSKEQPDQLIGTCVLFKFQKENYRAEVGYMLAHAYHRKGIITEAVHEILKYGFDTLGLHSIEARVDPVNIASATLLEKLGFVREAFFRESTYFDGRFLDTAIYSLLSRNFNRSSLKDVKDEVNGSRSTSFTEHQ